MEYFKVNLKRLPLWSSLKSGDFKKARMVAMMKLATGDFYSGGFPCRPGIREIVRDEAPDLLVAAIDPLTAALIDKGFRKVGLHIPNGLGAAEGLTEHLLSSEATTVATVIVSRIGDSAGRASSFISQAQSGRWVITSNAPPALPTAPTVRNKQVTTIDAAEVWAIHQSRIAREELVELRPEAVFPFLLKLESTSVEHYLKLGLYEPASEEEVEAYRSPAPELS